MQAVRIALVQIDCVTGDVQQNLEKIRIFVQEAAQQRADIICISELCLTGYNMFAIGRQYFDLAQPVPGPVCEELAEAAARARAYVIVGLPLRGEVPGIIYNGGVVLSPEGEVVGRFGKTHPWSLEKLYFSPADWYSVVDTSAGRIGCMVCYDIAFPEVTRIMALRGAQIVFCPSAWRVEDDYIWFLSARARALENNVYLVAVNQVGIEPDTFGPGSATNLFGHSLVVNPRGDIVAEGDEREGVIVVSVDLDEVASQRSETTFLKDRRPEIYAEIADPAWARSVRAAAALGESGTP
jgi:predicted amidohydrolase